MLAKTQRRKVFELPPALAGGNSKRNFVHFKNYRDRKFEKNLFHADFANFSRFNLKLSA